MKIFTLIISLILTNLAFSQSKGELVVFSNLGEHFYLLLNGERQNQDGATNVKVQEVLPGFYSCKVISQNNLYALSANLEIKAGMRVTYRIVEKKGVPKLRYYTEQALETTSKPIAGQCVLIYGQSPVVQNTTTTTTTAQSTTVTNSNGTQPNTNYGTTNNPTNNGSNSTGVNVNMSGTNVSTNVGNTTTTGTTTQTTSQGTIQNETIGNDENVNISINMSETGFSTNINTNGNGNTNIGTSGNMNGNSTTTTTTTSTTTSNTVGGNADYKPKPVSGKPSNCLVDAPGMSTAIAMIKKESFADNKMSVAKQFTKVKCLTVLQIKEIATLFDYSEDKMEYVKFAYDHCLNTSDYYQLSDVFTFSDDKDEFNGFLQSK